MSRAPMWRRYLRFRGPDPAADLDDELRFHLEMRAREYEARGMDPEAARAEAARRFGDVRRVKRECEEEDRRMVRARRRRERLGVALWEVRLAARALRRSPAFTAVTVLTLALGIGANTAVFSVVNGVLLKPLPYPQPDRLVRPFTLWQGDRFSTSPPDFVDWREEARSYRSLAAFTDGGFAVTGDGPAESVSATFVTPEFFGVLGVAPALGAGFTPEHGVPGSDRAAVLSNRFWRRRFGGDPGVVGSTVTLDGEPYRVVGVMPEGFAFPRDAELWVPLAFDERDLTTQRGAHYLGVVGRLRDGVEPAEADAELRAIAARLEAEYPRSNEGYGASVVGLREAMVGDVRPALLILLGAVGLVLLIACANAANLLLVRSVARERELAVRAALGAGRRRLLGGLLVESLLLAGAGAVVGLLLASGGTRLLASLHPESLPRLDEVGLDARVLGFTLLAALVTGLLFGLLPALRASRPTGVGASLRAGGRGSAGSRRSGRVSRLLVVAELALALALLAGAGLLMRSFLRLQQVEAGFDPEGVLTFYVTAPETRYGSADAVRAFHSAFLERARAVPGVEAAGGISRLPMDGGFTISVEWLDGVRVSDRDLYTQVRVAQPGYFEALGIPVLRGRGLQATDRPGAPLAAVVNESAARLLWPGEDPLGRTFSLGTTFGIDTTHAGGEVVGVARDVRDVELEVEARPQVFLSHAQFPVDGLGYAVRTAGEPTALVGPLRAELDALDPEVPLAEVETMRARMAGTTAERRFYLLLLATFAGAAILLAAVGIYGVMAYVAGQRRHEMGVRMALGASAGDVLRLMLRTGMLPALAGIGLGLLVSLAVGRILAGLLYDLSPTDPPTLAAVAAGLAAVALLACWLPARRATRVDPIESLRAE